LDRERKKENDAYRDFVRKLEGKRPLGRPRRRWEADIKTDLGEIERSGMDWIHLF
jgi:hypothetical protein